MCLYEFRSLDQGSCVVARCGLGPVLPLVLAAPVAAACVLRSLLSAALGSFSFMVVSEFKQLLALPLKAWRMAAPARRTTARTARKAASSTRPRR